MLLLCASVSAGVLGISTSAQAVLRVDGESVPLFDSGTAWMEVSSDRLHVVEARTTSDRPIATLELMAPEGMEVQIEWRGRNFAITSIRSVRPESVAAARSSSMGTVILQIGNLPGATTTPPGGAAPPPAVATGPVVVELVPKDTEWSNVWIDGEKVAEFRVGDTKKTVVLAPGAHKVEVRDFMEDETWVSGTLTVAGPGPVKFGFAQAGAEVYTDPRAWTPVK